MSALSFYGPSGLMKLNILATLRQSNSPKGNIMSVEINKAVLSKFLGENQVNKIFQCFRALGCEVENVDNFVDAPIYITLSVEGKSDRPFIGIFEAKEMTDGEVEMWVGIDDDRLIDGIDWYNSPHEMAEHIAEKLKVPAVPLITGFCMEAFELKDFISRFN
jgi:hypothetical protein|tara:strand:- start:872 stop:1357 length:486 start_codon:yes stop_codon:yes gene_type:complete